MRPSAATRFLHFALALISVGALLTWTLHHPFGLAIVAPCVLIAIAVFLLRPVAGLWLLPLLWPVVDLAPDTGWIHFPESLALVLSFVAGVGLRESLAPRVTHPEGSPFRTTPAALFLFALVASSYAISALRAHAPWPPFDTALFAGYRTPLNAVRLLLGFVQCLLLLPALHALGRISGPSAQRRLATGLAGGLCLAAIAAVIERWQFTGLMNFASDYRTTARFWEMHVGGAALDAWLALTLPFALAGFMTSRAVSIRVAYLAVLSVAAYAILTTFSRGLYAAVAVSIPLLLILLARSDRMAPARSADAPGPWGARLGILVLCVVAPMSFAGGGYRGLAALLGFAWLTYLSGGLLARPPAMAAWATMAGGALIGLAGFAVAPIPKGVYLFYGLMFLTGMAVTVLGWRQSRAIVSLLAIGLTSASATAAIALGAYWGEGEGLEGIVLSALAIGVFLAFQHGVRPLWRANVHQATSSILVIGFAAALATTLGSYYVGERFSTTRQDFDGRMAHWRAGADLVRTREDALIGIGLGGYPEAYFWSGPLAGTAGTWQLKTEEGNTFVRLGAPRHVLGWGELFRVSQHVSGDATPPFAFRAKVRSSTDTQIHLEICRKHLLYDDGCAIGNRPVTQGDWQVLEIPSAMNSPDLFPSGLPVVFSFSVASGGVLDVDDVQIIDGRGMTLLDNGDFQSGIDFWFFSSDRYHLPWHAKSLPLHVWVEQGALGLFATGLTLLAGFGRLLAGRGRFSALSAPLVAGLTGFLIVGAFDSLLDMPRMTTAFYLGLWLALVLREPTPARGSRGSAV